MSFTHLFLHCWAGARKIIRAGEMTGQAKVPAGKPDDHIVKGELTPISCPLTSTLTCVISHRYTQNKNVKNV